MNATTFAADQIAPCGMNCGACSVYLAYSHGIPKKRGKFSHCTGCRARKKMCAYLKGACRRLATEKVRFCYECSDFPCERLQKIDNRYRTTYGISFIRNLEEIRDAGIRTFLENQRKSFLCPKCRKDVVSIHNKKCFGCDDVTSWRS
jgi:hypothetical protein